MNTALVNQLIKQEVQLLDKVEPLNVLAALIDDEFIEIGSSAMVFDKKEVLRWLASTSQSERVGQDFKAQALAENLILLNYISYIKDSPATAMKQARRSSIWRLSAGQWRMVFHQGTPMK